MYINQFLENLANVKINSAQQQILEKAYQVQFEEIILKIVALSKDGIFFEDDNFCRLLSLVEILHASEFLHVDFCNHKMLPLFDKGENDFIVYNYDTKKWCFFNIVDQSTWGVKNSLEEIMT